MKIIKKSLPCRLVDCPPGLFMYNGTLGFKSEYFASTPIKMEVFCVESGEFFWGGTSDFLIRAHLLVTPMQIVGADAISPFSP